MSMNQICTASWSDIARRKLQSVIDFSKPQIIPVSGGADSTALAILMVALFPQARYRFVFCDTGSEGDAVYASIQKLEQYLGIKVEFISAGKTLKELIKQYNGFLPSAQKRWCTRVLKIDVFQKWLAALGDQCVMHVGVRSDEDRLAFVSEKTVTSMPFVELGLRREHIFKLLSRTVGVPSLYKHRSRSGCNSCPFSTVTESIGLMKYYPIEFQEGADLEKLSPSYKERMSSSVQPYWETSGLARNWQGLPMPDWSNPSFTHSTDVGRNAASHTPDRAKNREAGLFGPGTQGVWVAAEIWVDDWYLEPVVWYQDVAAFSTSLAGLKKQVDQHYQSRIRSAEVWDMTEDEAKRNIRFVLYYVEIDLKYFSMARPDSDSYTWQQGNAYLRTQHVVKWSQAVLWSVTAGVSPRSMDGNPVHAELLHMEIYQPNERQIDEEIDIRQVACPICTN